MEQERLRGLMERMSMDPSSSPPKQPTLRKADASPLVILPQTPMYPKTNFSGQYQVPNSPPPTQSTMPQPYLQHQQSQHAYGQQQSYNPGIHGRIPGPASPPPTQTAFSLGSNPSIRRGPASPPPTQTSFPQQASQYSTYGNPRRVINSNTTVMYRQGSSPRPPPPGPPPLGPQQTFRTIMGATTTNR